MTHLLEFFGRLHPMLVHLPIGFLVIAIILIGASHYKRAKVSRSALSLLFLCSAFAAILSCVTGYLLSQSGEYNEETLSWHKGMGIALAAMSSLGWLIIRDGKHTKTIQFISVILFIMLVFTGHWGASLTHGGEYLTEPLAAIAQPETPPMDLSKVNFNEVKFYPDLVHPILEKKCISCHSAEKQKGNLRLDNPEFILKGGKSGKAVVAFRKDESELLYRIHLGAQDKKHMPPKEKPSLSEQEIQLIDLWIESGADFGKKFADLVPEPKRNALLSHQQPERLLPDREISAADPRVLESLVKKGVSITPISSTSNYLSISFISVPRQAVELLPELSAIGNHIVELKLTGCAVGNESISALKSLSNLTRVSLDDTPVTDAALTDLALLPRLSYLNLKGTSVTLAGIEKLKNATNLRHLYLYQTKIKAGDQAKIRALLPKTLVDFGGYEVPTLLSDTQVVKPLKK